MFRKTAGSGSCSQGGKILPCNLEDRSKIAFSPVGRSLVCFGPLTFGAFDDDAGTVVGVEVAGVADRIGNPAAGVLMVSANAISSWHLRFKRVLWPAVGASLAAFMYSSAAWMAWLRASRPEVLLILASCSCSMVSCNLLMWTGHEG